MKTEPEKPAFYWQIAEFETREELQSWVEENDQSCRWHEIFLNNAYGVEYIALRQI